MQLRTALFLLGALPAWALGQQTMVGYSAANAAKQRDLEANAIKRPSATIASTHSRELSKETHVAGTPAQARTRDYVIAQMKKWGMETEVRAYDVWMPHPVSVKQPPNEGDLLELLYRFAPDPVIRRKILVDNPARLFGFG